MRLVHLWPCLALLLSACGPTKATSGTSGHSGSTGPVNVGIGTGSTGNQLITSTTTGTTGTGSTSAHTSSSTTGTSRGTTASGVTGSISSTTTSSTTSTTGGCATDGVYVGQGNADRCCSDTTDPVGYCITPGPTTTSTSSTTTGSSSTTSTSSTTATATATATTTTTSSSSSSTGGTTGGAAICSPCTQASDCASGYCNSFAAPQSFCDSIGSCAGSPQECDGLSCWPGNTTVCDCPQVQAVCTPVTCIYAHSNTDLYTVNPNNQWVLADVCSFSGLNSGATLFDLAINNEGTMYAVAVNVDSSDNEISELYYLDPNSCAATYVGSQVVSAVVNGLTFDSTDTLYASDTAGNVFTVDVTTGAMTQVGAFNLAPYGTSGDILFAEGYFFATAHDPSCAAPCDDTLLYLDPNNGFTAYVIGDIGRNDIYGLGFAQGWLFGFDDSGNMVEINPNTGAVAAAANLGSIVFYGAATTPSAQ